MEGHPTIENVFKPYPGGMGMDGNMGWGGQGGILGLIALLSLLGRGTWGNQGSNDTIMATLADLKAEVPLTACETKGQVVASANDTNAQILQQTLALMNQGAQGQLATAQGFANTGDKLDAGFAAGALATANSAFATIQAVGNDGDKTRALIQSIDKSNDSRLITSLQNEIVELRQDSRRRDGESGLRIDMIQNQNQQQQQAQQQQFLLSQLLPMVNEALQVARATNSNVIVGNTGPVGTRQTANPTNVKA